MKGGLYGFEAIDTSILEGRIGKDTRIWASAHISRGAVVGSGCMIGEGAHVGKNVRIGDGCKIQNGAQLFEGVALEDDVFVGPHVVFTNVLTPRAFINKKHEFKRTPVARGVSIGANATILCGITIGEYAMIGAGSVVTRNVGDHELWYGNPAVREGHVCKCGERLTRSQIEFYQPFTGSAIGDKGVFRCSACRASEIK